MSPHPARGSGGRARTGLLVMAYGTPAGPDHIEEYYTHIRRGRRPEPAQLAELTARYDAIGGLSPLARRSRGQVTAIAQCLERRVPGGFVTRLGQKHAAPFIEDAVAELLAEDVKSIVGIVLAPHFSAASVGQYHARAAAATGSTPFLGIKSWHMLDPLLEFHASAVKAALASLPADTQVVFTAHSLPERALENDQYPDQLHESACEIARRVGLDGSDAWTLGWQSAGRTPDPWRGPDIREAIEELSHSEHRIGTSDGKAVLVVPQGFTSDHLEILYDLDIEAAAAAERAGWAFARTPVINDDPTVMSAVADLVVRTASAQQL